MTRRPYGQIPSCSDHVGSQRRWLGGGDPAAPLSGTRNVARVGPCLRLLQMLVVSRRPRDLLSQRLRRLVSTCRNHDVMLAVLSLHGALSSGLKTFLSHHCYEGTVSFLPAQHTVGSPRDVKPCRAG